MTATVATLASFPAATGRALPAHVGIVPRRVQRRHVERPAQVAAAAGDPGLACPLPRLARQGGRDPGEGGDLSGRGGAQLGHADDERGADGRDPGALRPRCDWIRRDCLGSGTVGSGRLQGTCRKGPWKAWWLIRCRTVSPRHFCRQSSEYDNLSKAAWSNHLAERAASFAPTAMQSVGHGNVTRTAAFLFKLKESR